MKLDYIQRRLILLSYHKVFKMILNPIIDTRDGSFLAFKKNLRLSRVIGLSMVGKNVGRDGIISWIQINTNQQIFILDVVSLGISIFLELKDFFEDPKIMKVIHDCRFISEFLWHKFRINLTTVFDTQVADVIIYRAVNRNLLPKELKSLYDCIKEYISPPLEDFYGIRTKLSYYSEKPELFFVRPADESMIATLSNLTLYLKPLRQAQMALMLKDFYDGVDIHRAYFRDAPASDLLRLKCSAERISYYFQDFKKSSIIVRKKEAENLSLATNQSADGACRQLNEQLSALSIRIPNIPSTPVQEHNCHFQSTPSEGLDGCEIFTKLQPKGLSKECRVSGSENRSYIGAKKLNKLLALSTTEFVLMPPVHVNLKFETSNESLSVLPHLSGCGVANTSECDVEKISDNTASQNNIDYKINRLNQVFPDNLEIVEKKCKNNDINGCEPLLNYDLSNKVNFKIKNNPDISDRSILVTASAAESSAEVKHPKLHSFEGNIESSNNVEIKGVNNDNSGWIKRFCSSFSLLDDSRSSDAAANVKSSVIDVEASSNSSNACVSPGTSVDDVSSFYECPISRNSEDSTVPDKQFTKADLSEVETISTNMGANMQRQGNAREIVATNHVFTSKSDDEIVNQNLAVFQPITSTPKDCIDSESLISDRGGNILCDDAFSNDSSSASTNFEGIPLNISNKHETINLLKNLYGYCVDSEKISRSDWINHIKDKNESKNFQPNLANGNSDLFNSKSCPQLGFKTSSINNFQEKLSNNLVSGCKKDESREQGLISSGLKEGLNKNVKMGRGKFFEMLG